MILKEIPKKKYNDLVVMLRNRFEESEEKHDELRDIWRHNEALYWAESKKIEDLTSREKESNTIDIPRLPILHGHIQTLLAYLLTTFTQKTPMMDIQGQGPEDVKPAKLLEIVLEWESRTRPDIITLYTILKQALINNYSVGKTVYEQEYRNQSIVSYDELSKEYKRSVVEKLYYEGNTLSGIHPDDFFHDIHVPLFNFQYGEYCIHRVYRSINHIREMGRLGYYSNTDKVVPCEFKDGKLTPIEEERGDSRPSDTSVDGYGRGWTEVKEMWVKWVPKDMFPGGSEKLCMWVITIAGEILIRAEPSPYGHGEFPFQVYESDPDGHSTYTKSLVEVMAPFQDDINFLYANRRADLRKNVLGMQVFDPSLVDVDHIMNPNMALRIPVKQGAYGRGMLDKAIYQLPIRSVTQEIPGEIDRIIRLMERGGAPPEGIAGMPTGGRKTAREVGIMAEGGLNKIQLLAQIIAEMGIKPWYRQRIANIQQFMSEQRFVAITGNIPDELQEFAQGKYIGISPDLIQANVDFLPFDATIPLGKMDEIEMFSTMMQSVPQVDPQGVLINIPQMWKDLMRKMGVKNVDSYFFKEDQSDQARLQKALSSYDGAMMIASEAGKAIEGHLAQNQIQSENQRVLKESVQ